MTEIRNIAVIAHVDHGKTTLVDALLKQSHVFRDNQAEMSQTTILDRNELERERGITILAKNCAIQYKGTKINIIDTPGHADFSGEVERTLGMADAALLIVDAQEGPMPQTRFVLKKALELGLKIIVVVNKIDKKFARPAETVQKVETLFLELAQDDSQLDFPVLYAVGRNGTAWKELPSDPESAGDVLPLLEAIMEDVPVAKHREGTFKMVVTSIDYDKHLGRIVVGEIYQGKVEKGMKVIVTKNPNSISRVEKLFTYEGLGSVEVESAESGEIVSFAGVADVTIGDTVSDPSDTVSLPGASISEPTLHMTMGPNTSPFAGREGQFTTSRQLEERLDKELESNLSLRVEKMGNGKFTVSGRGELHLSILLETMRREGYEMEVGKPEVIVKEIDGAKMEPVEEVSVIVPNEFVGTISEEFGKRYAKMTHMGPLSDTETEFIFHAPTRVLLGLRSYLLTQTKGTVIYNSVISGYEPIGKLLPKLRRGALIADQAGEALGYGLQNVQERGTTFIDPATPVYEGMIIGINAKDEDIAMNVCKGKKLTNMRSKASDGVLQLTPATKFSLEQSLDFLENDELLEITPLNLRLRKKHLSDLDRRRFARSGANL
jgi:GTP-binding protein